MTPRNAGPPNYRTIMRAKAWQPRAVMEVMEYYAPRVRIMAQAIGRGWNGGTIDELEAVGRMAMGKAIKRNDPWKKMDLWRIISRFARFAMWDWCKKERNHRYYSLHLDDMSWEDLNALEYRYSRVIPTPAQICMWREERADDMLS